MKNEKEFLSDSIISLTDELIAIVDRGCSRNDKLHFPGSNELVNTILSMKSNHPTWEGLSGLPVSFEENWPIVATIGKRLDGVPLIEFIDPLEQQAIEAARTFVPGMAENLMGFIAFKRMWLVGYKAASKDKNWTDADIVAAMDYALVTASQMYEEGEAAQSFKEWESLQRKVPTRLVFDPNSADSSNTIFIDPSKVEYASHN